MTEPGRCQKFRRDAPPQPGGHPPRCGILLTKHPKECPSAKDRNDYLSRVPGVKRKSERRSTSFTPEEVALQLAIVETLARGGDLRGLARSRAYATWSRKVLVMADRIPPKRLAKPRAEASAGQPSWSHRCYCHGGPERIEGCPECAPARSEGDRQAYEMNVSAGRRLLTHGDL